MSTARHKRQVLALYRRQDGRCHWCECDMLPPGPDGGKRPNPRQCTLDHLDDRFNPERGKRAGEIRRVAACWLCNHSRGVESQAKVGRRELNRRCGVDRDLWAWRMGLRGAATAKLAEFWPS